MIHSAGMADALAEVDLDVVVGIAEIDFVAASIVSASEVVCVIPAAAVAAAKTVIETAYRIFLLPLLQLSFRT